MMINWLCRHTWIRSAKNTLICLIGCMSGDYGALFLLQAYDHINLYTMFLVAVPVGLCTSITLETMILLRQMKLKEAVITACGMSFFSMIMMESAANLMALWLNDGNRLVWWVIIPSTIAGFLVAWPYNYYRLKRFSKACH